MRVVPGGSSADGLSSGLESEIFEETINTSVVAVVWGLSQFANHGRFSVMRGIAVPNHDIELTSEIHYKTSKYTSRPTSSMP